jgi:hypothetical protein
MTFTIDVKIPNLMFDALLVIISNLMFDAVLAIIDVKIPNLMLDINKYKFFYLICTHPNKFQGRNQTIFCILFQIQNM